jgi:hypothetical protein
MTNNEEIKNSFDGSMVYGTKKFNRDTGRNDHYETAVKQATAFFIDQATGVLKEDMAEHRACPICGVMDSDELFTKDGFRHAMCSCGFIFVNPTAKDEYRDEFFRDKYQTWTGVLLTDHQASIDYKKFSYGLQFIGAHVRGKGLMVDIGAGSGLFLKAARDVGWRVSGVEFNTSAVEHIKSMGIEVFDKPLEDGASMPIILLMWRPSGRYLSISMTPIPLSGRYETC